MLRHAVAFLAVASLGAQTAETIPFRAVLSSLTRTPASGGATVLLHVVRDSSGAIVSASWDLRHACDLPEGSAVTAAHVHRGTGPAAADLDAATAGAVIADPSAFGVDVHTNNAPGGIVRGVLQRAESAVFMALMEPANEVPAVSGLSARAVASLTVIAARDSARRVTSAEVVFDANFTFPPFSIFTGFQLHSGAARTNGPLLVDSGLIGGAFAPITPTGSGNLHYKAEVPAAALAAVASLLDNPGRFYLNLRTAASPAGAVRGQLRTTDVVRWPVLLGGVPGSVTVHTIREGTAIAGGVVVFDVNHSAKEAGSLVIARDGARILSSGIGSGVPGPNVFAPVTVSETGELAQMLADPGQYDVVLDRASAKLAPPDRDGPLVSAVVSAVTDLSLKAVAPGGLMTVFGVNLSKTPADVSASFNGVRLPLQFNGTEVLIGGKAAPVAALTREYIVAQVPWEVTPGSQEVVVRTANGSSAPWSIEVAPNAPGIYFDASAGTFTTAQYQLTGRPGAAARKADRALWVYWTGLGTLTPLGAVKPETGVGTMVSYRAEDVQVLIDEKPARVQINVASPGYPGLYQTYFDIPQDLTAGTHRVQLRVRGAESNVVPVVVQ